LRAAFDVVVARSFGPPPVVAECAAPFLRTGGVLVVSEPPVGSGRGSAIDHAELPVPNPRWPAGPLAALGLHPTGLVRNRFGYQVLHQVSVCPERFPRRVGVPAKRPLYQVPDRESG
jgi:16S rRNA (guanine527-N7)-methyltransferase